VWCGGHRHPEITAGLILVRVGSTDIDASTDYLSVLKLVRTERRPLTMSFRQTVESGAAQRSAQRYTVTSARAAHAAVNNTPPATPVALHAPSRAATPVSPAASASSAEVEAGSPVDVALLAELQRAAGDVVESSHRHLAEAGEQADKARRREEMTQQHRLRHATQLSPLERSALTLAAGAAAAAAATEGGQSPPTLPTDTHAQQAAQAGQLQQQQDAAFDVGGIVREKMAVIQALKRELAERDAQLAHASEIAERYTRAVRVAELACTQLKVVEGKLAASEAQAVRLRGQLSELAAATVVKAAVHATVQEAAAARGGGGGGRKEEEGDDSIEDIGDASDHEAAAGAPPAVRVAVVRCCLSCGHKNTGSHGDCASCGIMLSRPCPNPECGAELKNGASMCLACLEIDNAHVARPRARDDLALQPWGSAVAATAEATAPPATGMGGEEKAADEDAIDDESVGRGADATAIEMMRRL
jgi:hypothetical protein